jgi:TPR repeat protein
MYGDGKGTKNNEREAAKWLKKAAEAGHQEAAELLKTYTELKNSDQ